MNSITCRVCQTQNSTGNKFCSNCGASLKPRTHITCPNCFHRNPLHLLYCDNCGTRLERSSTTLNPDAVADNEGTAEPKPATQPFSLPTRRPGETGDLDPDRLPDWLRTGEPSEGPDDSADDFGFAASAAAIEDDLIPDWLAELNDEADETPQETAAEIADREPDTFLEEDGELAEEDPTPEPLPHSAPLVSPDEVDPTSLDWLSELSDINPEETLEQSELTAEGSLGIHTTLLDNLFEVEPDQEGAPAGEPLSTDAEMGEGFSIVDLPEAEGSHDQGADDGQENDPFESDDDQKILDPVSPPLSLTQELRADIDDAMNEELAEMGWARFGSQSPPDDSSVGLSDEESFLDTVIDEPAPVAGEEPESATGFTGWLDETTANEQTHFDLPDPSIEEEEPEDFLADLSVPEDQQADDDSFIELFGSDLEGDLEDETFSPGSAEDRDNETADWMSSLEGGYDESGDETVPEELELPFDVAESEDDTGGSDPAAQSFLKDVADDDAIHDLDPDLSHLFDDQPVSDDPFATIIEQGTPFSFDDDAVDGPVSEDQEKIDWLDDLEKAPADEQAAEELRDFPHEPLLGQAEGASSEEVEPAEAEAQRPSEGEEDFQEEGDDRFLEELAAMRTQTTTQVGQFSFEGAPGWFHGDDDLDGAEQYKQIGGPLDGMVGVIPIAPAIAKVSENIPPLSTEFVEERDPGKELALWSETLDAGQSAEPKKVDDPVKPVEEGRRNSLRLIYLLLLFILLILFFRLYLPSVYENIAEGVQAAFRLITTLFR